MNANAMDKPHYTNKTVWTPERDTFLLNTLAQTARDGLGSDIGFSKEGWRRITLKLNQQFGTNLDKAHVKNHVQILRRMYEAWVKLKVTPGFVWNPERNLYEAPDHVWQRFIAANHNGKHFRSKSFVYEKVMREIFPRYRHEYSSLTFLVQPQPQQQQQEQQTQSTQQPSQQQQQKEQESNGDQNLRHEVQQELDRQQRQLRSANIFESVSAETNFIPSQASGEFPSQTTNGRLSSTPELQISTPIRPAQQPPPSSPSQPSSLSPSSSSFPSATTSLHRARQPLTPASLSSTIPAPASDTTSTTPLIVDPETFTAAVKLVSESFKDSFKQILDVVQASRSPSTPAPATSVVDPATAPTNSAAFEATLRFQEAIKLLSSMRQTCGWSREQYSRAIQILRSMDETGIILFLEMDADAREDYLFATT
ncbi:Myb/SANT-like DNA-binding domain-containing protein [Myxozyma melibiosi]|uniref:Myb/SANT-like DNA-binding domain-containing protein n=1 Tax=Myxozyma melibiosi TaxID=54550 RepID=A0ABR1F2C8_9ASCO